jgi:hypothetical protein
MLDVAKRELDEVRAQLLDLEPIQNKQSSRTTEAIPARDRVNADHQTAAAHRIDTNIGILRSIDRSVRRLRRRSLIRAAQRQLP